jgi:2-oxoglutarate ferredoxin oxidoreductase subunit alpha
VQGACPVQWYGKCGGEVPTPEEIIDVVTRVLKENA